MPSTKDAFISYLGGYGNPLLHFLLLSVLGFYLLTLMLVGEIFLQFSCLVILMLLESRVRYLSSVLRNYQPLSL